MEVLYYPSSPDEAKRIAVLLNLSQMQTFGFEADAAQVVYHTHNLAVIFDTTVSEKTDVARPITLANAYKKVIEQIRQAETYLGHASYEEPIIEEENIQYPRLNDVDTHEILRLRR